MKKKNERGEGDVRWLFMAKTRAGRLANVAGEGKGKKLAQSVVANTPTRSNTNYCNHPRPCIRSAHAPRQPMIFA